MTEADSSFKLIQAHASSCQLMPAPNKCPVPQAHEVGADEQSQLQPLLLALLALG